MEVEEKCLMAVCLALRRFLFRGDFLETSLGFCLAVMENERKCEVERRVEKW